MGTYKYDGSTATRSLELLGREEGMFALRKEARRGGETGDWETREQVIAGFVRIVERHGPSLLKAVAEKHGYEVVPRLSVVEAEPATEREEPKQIGGGPTED